MNKTNFIFGRFIMKNVNEGTKLFVSSLYAGSEVGIHVCE